MVSGTRRHQQLCKESGAASPHTRTWLSGRFLNASAPRSLFECCLVRDPAKPRVLGFSSKHFLRGTPQKYGFQTPNPSELPRVNHHRGPAVWGSNQCVWITRFPAAEDRFTVTMIPISPSEFCTFCRPRFTSLASSTVVRIFTCSRSSFSFRVLDSCAFTFSSCIWSVTVFICVLDKPKCRKTKTSVHAMNSRERQPMKQ